MAFDFYQSPNKDSGYATASDDPSKDLFDFDEYLNRDPSQLIINAGRPDEFEAFDFNFDFDGDTTTSGSFSTGSAGVSDSQPDRHLSTTHDPLSPQRSSALRPQRALRDRFNPSISGDELLSIQSTPQLHATVTSPPSASGVPTLRRKGNFCASTETIRGRSQRVSKRSSNDTMQPSYYFKQDVPSYQEWTQRFGQISLQQPEAPSGLSSSPISKSTQHEALRSPYIHANPPHLGHRKLASEQIPPRYHHAQERQVPDQTLFTSQENFQSLATQAPIQSEALQGSYQRSNNIGQANNTSRHSRQAASWSPGPNNILRHDYTVSPGQLRPGWEHSIQENSASYFSNAAQSSAMPDYSAPDYSMHYNTYDPLSNDSSNQHHLGQLHQTLSAGQEQYQLNPSNNNQTSLNGTTHPQTPPSTTPPSQDPPPSSRQAKASKRRSKVGALRLPKSAGNLKSAKSSRDLRSPKSAGALKSSKSTAGLKSPPAGEFGFVNFTPKDSGKILTGVAPTGSAKTKARREQEANEKRRRLSMAAERVIREAGGDPEKLRIEGLL